MQFNFGSSPSEESVEPEPIRYDFSSPIGIVGADKWRNASVEERVAAAPQAFVKLTNSLEEDKSRKISFTRNDGSVTQVPLFRPNGEWTPEGVDYLERSRSFLELAARHETGGAIVDPIENKAVFADDLNTFFSEAKKAKEPDLFPELSPYMQERNALVKEGEFGAGNYKDYVDFVNSKIKDPNAHLDPENKEMESKFNSALSLASFDTSLMGEDEMIRNVGGRLIMNPKNFSEIDKMEEAIKSQDISDSDKKMMLIDYRKKVDENFGKFAVQFGSADSGVIFGMFDRPLQDEVLKGMEDPNFSGYEWIKKNKERLSKDSYGLGSEIASKFRDSLMATGTGALLLASGGKYTSPAEEWGAFGENTSEAYGNAKAFSVFGLDVNRRDLTELTGQVGSFLAMGGLGALTGKGLAAIGTKAAGAEATALSKFANVSSRYGVNAEGKLLSEVAKQTAADVAARGTASLGSKTLGVLKKTFTDPEVYLGSLQAGGASFGKTFNQEFERTGDRELALKASKIEAVSDGLSAFIATGVMNRVAPGMGKLLGASDGAAGGGIVQNLKNRALSKSSLDEVKGLLGNLAGEEGAAFRAIFANGLKSSMDASAKSLGLKGAGIFGNVAAEAVEESSDEIISDVISSMLDDSKTWDESVWQNIGTKWKEYVKAGVLGAIGGAMGDVSGTALNAKETFGESKALAYQRARWDMIKKKVPTFESMDKNVFTAPIQDAKNLAEYIAMPDSEVSIEQKANAMVASALGGKVRAGIMNANIPAAPKAKASESAQQATTEPAGASSEGTIGSVLESAGVKAPEGRQWRSDMPLRETLGRTPVEIRPGVTITSMSVGDTGKGASNVQHVAAKMVAENADGTKTTTYLTAAQAVEEMGEMDAKDKKANKANYKQFYKLKNDFTKSTQDNESYYDEWSSEQGPASNGDSKAKPDGFQKPNEAAREAEGRSDQGAASNGSSESAPKPEAVAPNERVNPKELDGSKISIEGYDRSNGAGGFLVTRLSGKDEQQARDENLDQKWLDSDAIYRVSDFTGRSFITSSSALVDDGYSVIEAAPLNEVSESLAVKDTASTANKQTDENKNGNDANGNGQADGQADGQSKADGQEKGQADAQGQGNAVKKEAAGEKSPAAPVASDTEARNAVRAEFGNTRSGKPPTNARSPFYRIENGIYVFNKDPKIIYLTDEAIDAALKESDGDVSAAIDIIDSQITALTGFSPASALEIKEDVDPEDASSLTYQDVIYFADPDLINGGEDSLGGKWGKVVDRNGEVRYSYLPPDGNALAFGVGHVVSLEGKPDEFLVVSRVFNGKWEFARKNVNDAVGDLINDKGLVNQGNKFTKTRLASIAKELQVHFNGVLDETITPEQMEEVFMKVMKIVSPEKDFNIEKVKMTIAPTEENPNPDNKQFIYAEPNLDSNEYGTIKVDFEALAAQLSSLYRGNRMKDSYSKTLLGLDAARVLAAIMDEEITHLIGFKIFTPVEMNKFYQSVLNLPKNKDGSNHPFFDMLVETLRERFPQKAGSPALEPDLKSKAEGSVGSLPVDERVAIINSVSTELIRKLNQLATRGTTTERDTALSRELQLSIYADEITKARGGENAQKGPLEVIGFMVRRFAERVRNILWMRWQQGMLPKQSRDILARLNKAYRAEKIQGDVDFGYDAAKDEAIRREREYEEAFVEETNKIGTIFSPALVKLRGISENFGNMNLAQSLEVNPETMRLDLHPKVRSYIERYKLMDLEEIDKALFDLNGEMVSTSSYQKAVTSVFLKQQVMDLRRDELSFDPSELLDSARREKSGDVNHLALWNKILDGVPREEVDLPNVFSKILQPLIDNGNQMWEEMELLRKKEIPIEALKAVNEIDLTNPDFSAIRKLLKWGKVAGVGLTKRGPSKYSIATNLERGDVARPVGGYTLNEEGLTEDQEGGDRTNIAMSPLVATIEQKVEWSPEESLLNAPKERFAQALQEYKDAILQKLILSMPLVSGSDYALFEKNVSGPVLESLAELKKIEQDYETLTKNIDFLKNKGSIILEGQKANKPSPRRGKTNNILQRPDTTTDAQRAEAAAIYNQYIAFSRAVEDYNNSIKFIKNRAIGDFGKRTDDFGMEFANMNVPTGEGASLQFNELSDELTPASTPQDVFSGLIVPFEQLIGYGSKFISQPDRGPDLTEEQIAYNKAVQIYRDTMKSNANFVGKNHFLNYWVALQLGQVNIPGSPSDYERTGGFLFERRKNEIDMEVFESVDEAFPDLDTKEFYSAKFSLKSDSPQGTLDVIKFLQKAREWSDGIKSKYQGDIIENIGNQQSLAGRMLPMLEGLFGKPEITINPINGSQVLSLTDGFDSRLNREFNDLMALLSVQYKTRSDYRLGQTVDNFVDVFELQNGKLVPLPNAPKSSVINKAVSDRLASLERDNEFEVYLRSASQGVRLMKSSMKAFQNREWHRNVEREGSRAQRDPAFEPDNKAFLALREQTADARLANTLGFVIKYFEVDRNYFFGSAFAFEMYNNIQSSSYGEGREPYMRTKSQNDFDQVINPNEYSGSEDDPRVANSSMGNRSVVKDWTSTFNEGRASTPQETAQRDFGRPAVSRAMNVTVAAMFIGSNGRNGRSMADGQQFFNDVIRAERNGEWYNAERIIAERKANPSAFKGELQKFSNNDIRRMEQEMNTSLDSNPNKTTLEIFRAFNRGMTAELVKRGLKGSFPAVGYNNDSVHDELYAAFLDEFGDKTLSTPEYRFVDAEKFVLDLLQFKMKFERKVVEENRIVNNDDIVQVYKTVSQPNRFVSPDESERIASAIKEAIFNDEMFTLEDSRFGMGAGTSNAIVDHLIDSLPGRTIIAKVPQNIADRNGLQKIGIQIFQGSKTTPNVLFMPLNQNGPITSSEKARTLISQLLAISIGSNPESEKILLEFAAKIDSALKPVPVVEGKVVQYRSRPSKKFFVTDKEQILNSLDKLAAIRADLDIVNRSQVFISKGIGQISQNLDPKVADAISIVSGFLTSDAAKTFLDQNYGNVEERSNIQLPGNMREELLHSIWMIRQSKLYDTNRFNNAADNAVAEAAENEIDPTEDKLEEGIDAEIAAAEMIDAEGMPEAKVSAADIEGSALEANEKIEEELNANLFVSEVVREVDKMAVNIVIPDVISEGEKIEVQDIDTSMIIASADFITNDASDILLFNAISSIIGSNINFKAQETPEFLAQLKERMSPKALAKRSTKAILSGKDKRNRIKDSDAYLAGAVFKTNATESGSVTLPMSRIQRAARIYIGDAMNLSRPNVGGKTVLNANFERTRINNINTALLFSMNSVEESVTQQMTRKITVLLQDAAARNLQTWRNNRIGPDDKQRNGSMPDKKFVDQFVQIPVNDSLIGELQSLPFGVMTNALSDSRAKVDSLYSSRDKISQALARLKLQRDDRAKLNPETMKENWRGTAIDAPVNKGTLLDEVTTEEASNLAYNREGSSVKLLDDLIEIDRRIEKLENNLLAVRKKIHEIESYRGDEVVGRSNFNTVLGAESLTIDDKLYSNSVNPAKRSIGFSIMLVPDLETAEGETIKRSEWNDTSSDTAIANDDMKARRREQYIKTQAVIQALTQLTKDHIEDTYKIARNTEENFENFNPLKAIRQAVEIAEVEAAVLSDQMDRARSEAFESNYRGLSLDYLSMITDPATGGLTVMTMEQQGQLTKKEKEGRTFLNPNQFTRMKVLNMPKSMNERRDKLGVLFSQEGQSAVLAPTTVREQLMAAFPTTVTKRNANSTLRHVAAHALSLSSGGHSYFMGSMDELKGQKFDGDEFILTKGKSLTKEEAAKVFSGHFTSKVEEWLRIVRNNGDENGQKKFDTTGPNYQAAKNQFTFMLESLVMIYNDPKNLLSPETKASVKSILDKVSNNDKDSFSYIQRLTGFSADFGTENMVNFRIQEAFSNAFIDIESELIVKRLTTAMLIHKNEGPSLFTMKYLHHHDSRMRNRFQKDEAGRQAALHLQLILDKGIDGKSGRLAYETNKKNAQESIASAAKSLDNNALDQTLGYFDALLKGLDNAHGMNYAMAFDSFLKQMKKGFAQYREFVDTQDSYYGKNAISKYWNGSHIDLVRDKQLTEKIRQILTSAKATVAKDDDNSARVAVAKLRDTIKNNITKGKEADVQKYSDEVARVLGDIDSAMHFSQAMLSKPGNTDIGGLSKWKDNEIRAFKRTYSSVPMSIGYASNPSGEEIRQGEYIADPMDIVSFRDASFFGGVGQNTSFFDPKTIFRPIMVNGLVAPMSLIDDAIYRLNVTPTYEVLRRTVGKVKSEMGQLNIEDSGILNRIASEEIDQSLPNTQYYEKDYELKQRIAASTTALAFVANELETIIRNDFVAGSVNTGGAETLRFLGSVFIVRSLASVMQITNQSLSPSIGYVAGKFAVGKFAAAKNYFGLMQRYLTDSDFREKAKNFIMKNDPTVFLRSLDGREVLKDVSRGQKRYGDKVVRNTLGQGIRKYEKLGEDALNFTIGRVERLMATSIFLTELMEETGEVDADKILGGQIKPTDLDIVNSRTKVNDMLGQSDQSKKAGVMQINNQSPIVSSLMKSLFVFSNQTASTASNLSVMTPMAFNPLLSKIAPNTFKPIDKASQKDAIENIVTTLVQNVLFPVMKFKVLLPIVCWVIARAIYRDDEDEAVRHAQEMANTVLAPTEDGSSTANFVKGMLFGKEREFFRSDLDAQAAWASGWAELLSKTLMETSGMLPGGVAVGYSPVSTAVQKFVTNDAAASIAASLSGLEKSRFYFEKDGVMVRQFEGDAAENIFGTTAAGSTVYDIASAFKLLADYNMTDEASSNRMKATAESFMYGITEFVPFLRDSRSYMEDRLKDVVKSEK